MSDEFAMLATKNGSVRVDLALGNIARLELRQGGRVYQPLHRAHWVDDPKADLPVTMPFVEMRLSGDFLAAPFGAYALPEDPFHGPSANSPWHVMDTGTNTLNLALQARVSGARIQKRLSLDTGPFLYQTHSLRGGQGTLPVSTHPMVRLAPGDRIFLSPKQRLATPKLPLISGKNRLKYPAQSLDYKSFPGPDRSIDLSRFPSLSGTEDFVLAMEDPTNTIGWTALVRARDIVLILKDATVLPVTQLWFSDGGREDAPWSGRHTGVLGVEDANVPMPNARTAGLPLAPDRDHVLRHAIGVVGKPDGLSTVEGLKVIPEGIEIETNIGTMIVPFNTNFLTAIGPKK